MEKDNKIERVKNLLAEDRETRGEAALLSRELVYLLQSSIEATASPKISKAVAIGSTLFTLGSVVKGFYDIYKKSHAPEFFTIKITEDDAIFEIVENWFMEALPEESQRSVYAHSTVTKKEPKRRRRFTKGDSDSVPASMYDDSDDKDRVSIGFSFDGTIAQSLTIAGHEVQVFTTVPEHRTMVADGGQKQNWNSRSINILCKTIESRNDVLDEIEKQSQHLVESQPRMFVSTRWGDFRRRSEIQPRSRNSVILKEGQMDRILGHLNTFLTNKAAYAKADIPFRTGILLYGDPGSGKSSTALAIANELKMNVYIITLSALLNDESLGDCFSNIPANSIVILEDIDTASAVKERDGDDSTGVTMSGMLNVLDGFQSPPGVITIMTTNRREVLDDAIIRPGRVDLMEKLDCLDSMQLRGLCEYFMGEVPENLPNITPDDKITSAEVMGVIRSHLPDFENAAEDMVRFVEDKLLEELDKKALTELVK